MAFVTIVYYLSEYYKYCASLTLRTQLFATFNNQKLSLIIVAILKQISYISLQSRDFKL